MSFEGEHKSFLENHSRYMTQKSANNSLISVTRNKRLESALIDGIEHSRAAREFLDSMIEMEKSFADKIRLEEELRHNASPEQIAALEAMKKSFYDDLHHRMQAFFQPQAG